MNPYTANLKRWDRVGNLNPGIEVTGKDRPWFDSAPAAWLPVLDSAINRGVGLFSGFEKRHEDWFVIFGGKVLALCRDAFQKEGTHWARGRLVPAGLRVSWAAAAGGDSVLEYGADDVARRTTDLATGAPVAAPVSYTKTQLTAALVSRGLLAPTEDLEAFVSRPVGLAPYAMYAWAGGDGWQPTGFGVHNYNRQHQAAVLCSYVCKLPLVPADTGSEDVVADTATASNVSDLDDGDVLWITSTVAKAEFAPTLGGVANDDFVGLHLGSYRLAQDTDRTPLRITRGGLDITDQVLVNKVSSPEDLTSDGDYLYDPDLGIIWFHAAGGTPLPTLVAAADVVTFYHYVAPAAAQLTEFASIVGAIDPGDYLTVDRNSNLRRHVVGVDAPEDVVGQVLSLKVGPHEELAKVKTYHEDFGDRDRMPGSATKGFNDLVTYAGAADTEVIFNLMK